MNGSAIYLRDAALGCAVALMLVPRPALAAWPNDPAQPLSIVNLAGIQAVSGAVADGAGGYFVTWYDRRAGNYDAYAQHLDAAGNAVWAANGVPVATGTPEQVIPTPVLDGAGGIIVGWEELGATSILFAQRLNAAGSPQWGAPGVQVAIQTNSQTAFAMCSDGAGGAEFAWVYAFSLTDNDIYAQRLSSTGTRLWGAGGMSVAASGANQDMVVAVSDGGSGIWVAWRDDRAVVYDIYAQHLDLNGVELLTSGGTNPENFVPGNIQGLVAVADGVGGFIASFSQNAYGDFDILMMHVFANGTYATTTISTASGQQTSPTLAADPTGGAFVFWTDDRTDVRKDIYGSHVTNYGSVSPGWPSQGLAVATGLDVYQDGPIAMGDGEGGAIVTWREGSSNARQIVAERFGPDAVIPPGWSFAGNPIATRPILNQGQFLAPTGNGGIFCTWTVPVGSEYDVVAQRIDRFGQIGTPEPHISRVKDVPNDQGGQLRVSWDASPLEAGLSPQVHGYQVWRQVPQASAQFALRSGAAKLLAPGEDAPGSGSVRWLRSIVTGAQTTYWEYAGGVAAQGFAGYSLVVSTTSDSVASSNPRTQVMVEAVGYFVAPGPTSPGTYWYSAPDSGYSVDNLPPVAPSPFSATYSPPNGTFTSWGANGEADLAGYRLYRGAPLNFTPSPANRIYQGTVPSYHDVTNTAYIYKVCAYDIHGNEGGCNTVQPAGTLDATSGMPSELSLAPISPNPSSGPTLLRFGLPRDGAMSLAIFDAQGRKLRTLISGQQIAGWIEAKWDGRDESGRRASSGLYFVRLEASGRTLVRRLAIVE